MKCNIYIYIYTRKTIYRIMSGHFSWELAALPHNKWLSSLPPGKAPMFVVFHSWIASAQVPVYCHAISVESSSWSR